MPASGCSNDQSLEDGAGRSQEDQASHEEGPTQRDQDTKVAKAKRRPQEKGQPGLHEKARGAKAHSGRSSSPDSEKAAAAWLLDRRWATQPDECSGCGGARFLDLVFPAQDALHWRCLGCGKREGLMQPTIFREMRRSSLLLVRLLMHYVRADLTHAFRATDVIQACGARQAFAGAVMLA